VNGGLAIVAVVGATIVAAGVWAAQSSKAALVIQCMDAETAERVRDIMHDGIDQGLKNHAVSIFSVWQKDPTDQPRRAITGMTNAINAYAGSREAVKNWKPLRCPE
jgi:hypothetical protein